MNTTRSKQRAVSRVERLDKTLAQITAICAEKNLPIRAVRGASATPRLKRCRNINGHLCHVAIGGQILRGKVILSVRLNILEQRDFLVVHFLAERFPSSPIKGHTYIIPKENILEACDAALVSVAIRVMIDAPNTCMVGATEFDLRDFLNNWDLLKPK